MKSEEGKVNSEQWKSMVFRLLLLMPAHILRQIGDTEQDGTAGTG
jgi:hypothetical protein